MKILAIETSCDDTCAAILKIKNLPRTEPRVLVRGQKSPKESLRLPTGQAKIKSFDVLSNVVSSQVKLHAKYGGVYPTLAKREHQKNLILVLKKALLEASLLRNSKSEIRNPKKTRIPKFKILNSILEREPELLKQTLSFLKKYCKPDIDAIAVTVGPGLEPCLWVGVNFARALAYFWDLPIIPVNHIEAHIIANWLSPVSSKSKIKNQPRRLRVGAPTKASEKSKMHNVFPAICLVVSGGHTQLILMKGFGNYKVIGETRDDAAGECFDKVARILGLGYPGGPAIAKVANMHKSDHKSSQINIGEISDKFVKISDIKLPRPMMYQKNYDFSFSGLKTAVLYDFKTKTPKIQKSQEYIKKICHETQQAIIDVLIHKTLKAAKEYKAKTIIIGGGVVANDELRKQLELKIKNLKLKINFLLPDKKFCTDNAAMTGITAYYRQKRKTRNWQKIKAVANLSIN